MAVLLSTILSNNDNSSRSWSTDCVPRPVLSTSDALAPLSLTTLGGGFTVLIPILQVRMLRHREAQESRKASAGHDKTEVSSDIWVGEREENG